MTSNRLQPEPSIGSMATSPPAPRQPADGAGIECCVGIMAHDEEANIANAIRTILRQPLGCCRISELIVVASGCTDRTAAIVHALALEDPRIRLIVQERRLGKASAINLFFKEARSPVLLMVGADVLVKPGSLDRLLRHFADPEVGMVGGRPIPVNDENTLVGFAVHLVWRLHDALSRTAPKLGEMVAFRNLLPSIPIDTAVDEISIQALILELGYRLVYEPEAIVYNHGPTSVGDFLRQRRRIYAGHLRVRAQQGYEASTMSVARIAPALLHSGSFATPRSAWLAACAVALEAVARGLGLYDFASRRQHQVWDMVTTTKRHINAQPHQSVAVFSIVNFHGKQLELGLHASRQLAQRIEAHLRRALQPNAVVSIQWSGAMVALLSADRGEAEGIAQQIVADFRNARWHLDGLRPGAAIELACAVVGLSQPDPDPSQPAQPPASALDELPPARLAVV